MNNLRDIWYTIRHLPLSYFMQIRVSYIIPTNLTKVDRYQSLFHNSTTVKDTIQPKLSRKVSRIYSNKPLWRRYDRCATFKSVPSSSPASIFPFLWYEAQSENNWTLNKFSLNVTDIRYCDLVLQKYTKNETRQRKGRTARNEARQTTIGQQSRFLRILELNLF